MITIIYIILGIILLIFSLQFMMILQARKSKGKKIEGLQGKLKSLEKKGSKGLVYFFSPSCHACKAQTPIIKELQSSNKNVYDVDISKDMDTARIFGVKATPSTIIVEDGIISRVLLGVKQKDILNNYLGK
ncbi:MAG TPA: thioredoxin family protein [Ignavibacteriaceae bacterium]|nr:thioredoxin family protein [Ignavibacteriaceae bacterium]